MAREMKADARHYLIDGQKVVRVSTVLSVISKPGLMMWYAKWGAEECRRLSGIATDFGTRFHLAMERHARGILLPWDIDPDMTDHVAAAIQWFDAHVIEVVGIERRVHSRVHGFAGTADLLARVRDVENVSADRPAALDWKTSKEVDFTYGFQLSAYLEGAREDGLDLTGRIVLQAPRERPGVFIPTAFPPAEHADDFEAFLHFLAGWRRVEMLERRQRNEWAKRKRAEERMRSA